MLLELRICRYKGVHKYPSNSISGIVEREGLKYVGDKSVPFGVYTKLHKSFLKMTQGPRKHMLFHSDSKMTRGFWRWDFYVRPKADQSHCASLQWRQLLVDRAVAAAIHVQTQMLQSIAVTSLARFYSIRTFLLNHPRYNNCHSYYFQAC